MRSEEIEKEMEAFLEEEGDVDDYIPIHDGEMIVGVVRKKDVSKVSDASYGGAWIGVERLIGFVDFNKQGIVVVNNGDYNYGRADYVVDENEQKRYDNGELIWNSQDCRLEEPEEDEREEEGL